MAGTPKQKQKVLFLLRILCERTDAESALTLSELSEQLERMGIKSERKSLYRDLAAISEAGFRVGTVRSKDTRYYWADRPLNRKDFLLLSNLLRVAPVVPRKRKGELEKKLRTLAPLSEQNSSFADLLSIIPEGFVTERVYSSVEVLFDAILSRKKVRFSYTGSLLRDASPRGRWAKYQTVSPYRLVWNDGYFYLVAANDEVGIAFYRVDRMESLEETPLASTDIREAGGDLDFDLNQYIQGYFASLEDPVHMIFRVSEGFLSGAERHFPSDSVIESATDGSYLLTCDVPANEGLFGWLLLHSEEIRLLYPESVVSRLREIARGCADAYGLVHGTESGINYEENGNTVDKSKKIGYN